MDASESYHQDPATIKTKMTIRVIFLRDPKNSGVKTTVAKDTPKKESLLFCQLPSPTQPEWVEALGWRTTLLWVYVCNNWDET